MNKNLILVGLCISVLCIIFAFVLFVNKGPASVYLDIDCNGISASGVYEKGDSFKCVLLTNEYEITVDKITKDIVYLKASDYGLCAQTDRGTISLMAKEKDFELKKGKQLILRAQATEVVSKMMINWK